MIRKLLIGASIVALSAISAVCVYRYAPLWLLDVQTAPQKFGSTVTTINGSDTLSSSRTTINTNFANLNADKIEATVTSLASLTSASALATVGTISSGIWHGTAIGAQWGGTGSTTLSANQLLLGNGTGNVGVVSGLGTSGQLLTSQGAGLPPHWLSASFDTTQNYTNTGLWVFTATTTMATTTQASSTISTLNITATSTFNGGLVGVYDYQDFTISGTWTKPTTVNANDLVTVQCWGGGGAGGGAANGTTEAGGGGGGGAFVEERYRASDLSSPVTVTIGAGGTGVSGADGNPGGSTTFGSLVTASGGGGGSHGSNGTGGVGAAGGSSGLGFGTSIYAGGAGGAANTTGTVSTFGGAGGGGGNAVGGAAGNGAAAYYGGAGGGGGSVSSTGGSGGTAKTGYGGAGGAGSTGVGAGSAASGLAAGGGGAATNGGGSSFAGGAGTSGECRIWTIK